MPGLQYIPRRNLILKAKLGDRVFYDPGELKEQPDPKKAPFWQVILYKCDQNQYLRVGPTLRFPSATAEWCLIEAVFDRTPRLN